MINILQKQEKKKMFLRIFVYKHAIYVIFKGISRLFNAIIAICNVNRRRLPEAELRAISRKRILLKKCDLFMSPFWKPEEFILKSGGI
jgi:hypothetical protein